MNEDRDLFEEESEKRREKEHETLVELIQKNKAAALGFAVLLAANALLSSCAPRTHHLNPDQKAYQSRVEKDEYGLDDRNTFYGSHHHGYHSYYHWGAVPLINRNPGVHGITHSTGWGTPPTHSTSGYSMPRGSSFGG